MTESGGGWLGREWSPRVPVRQDVVVGGGRESSSGSLGGWSETSGVPGYRGARGAQGASTPDRGVVETGSGGVWLWSAVVTHVPTDRLRW